MGALAGLLKAAGHDVRGSDEHVYPPMSTQLAEQGIPVFEGFRRREPRLGARRGRGRQRLPQGPRRGAGRAGARHPARPRSRRCSASCSSTTAPLAGRRRHPRQDHDLVAARPRAADAGRDPSFLIGGVPLNFRQSWRLGKGEDFVVEGDEYDTAFFDKKSKFLHYRPQIVHPDLGRVRPRRHLPRRGRGQGRLPRVRRAHPAGRPLVVCAASPGALEVAAAARCRVEHLRPPRLRRRLDLRGQRHARRAAGRPLRHRPPRRARRHRRDRPARRLQPREPGRRHRRRRPPRRRASPTSPAASAASWASSAARSSAASPHGVTVVDDFAHHPTAIRETLWRAQGPLRPGKLFAAFEPRSATSRRNVFQTELRRGAVASPTRWSWRRCTRRRRCPPPSAWTSNGWPPTCARQDVPARLIADRRRDRRAHRRRARRRATPWWSCARATTAACTTAAAPAWAIR